MHDALYMDYGQQVSIIYLSVRGRPYTMHRGCRGRVVPLVALAHAKERRSIGSPIPIGRRSTWNESYAQWNEINKWESAIASTRAFIQAFRSQISVGVVHFFFKKILCIHVCAPSYFRCFSVLSYFLILIINTCTYWPMFLVGNV